MVNAFVFKTVPTTLVLMTLPGTYIGAWAAPWVFKTLGSQRILFFYGSFMAISGIFMLGVAYLSLKTHAIDETQVSIIGILNF